MFDPSIDLRVAGLEKLAFSARVKCELVSHDRTNVDTTMITVIFLIMYILYKNCIIFRTLCIILYILLVLIVSRRSDGVCS